MINASELRARIGWNQRDLALYLGCDQSTVSRIENGADPNGPVSRLLVHLIGEVAAGRIPVKERRARRVRTQPRRAHAGGSR
jgi:transcriptional regulator with XRE-family HTH domain